MNISDVTRTIAGVEHSRCATSEIREEMMKKYLENMGIDFELANRYLECSKCEHLKEEFKLFGVTIKDKTPVCNKCGCSLYVKIPMSVFHCPESRW